MNLALAPAASLPACRARARELICLLVVVLVHLAALTLLPSTAPPTARPATPVTVTLIPPPAPRSAAPTPAAASQSAARTVEPKRVPPPPKAAESRVTPSSTASAPVKPSAATSGVPDTQDEVMPPRAAAATADPATASPADTPPKPAFEAAPNRSREPIDAARGSVVPPRFDAAYLSNPKPEYPRLARRLGEQGTVLLNVYVTPGGLPEKIEIHASSGSPRLDEAARNTVTRWNFVPARQGDRSVGAWIIVPIRFVLEG